MIECLVLYFESTFAVSSDILSNLDRTITGSGACAVARQPTLLSAVVAGNHESLPQCDHRGGVFPFTYEFYHGHHGQLFFLRASLRSPASPYHSYDAGMVFHTTYRYVGSFPSLQVLLDSLLMLDIQGVMLSIARSRLALALQVGFLSVNAGGLLLGIIYNNKTPKLYENNAHHSLGWAVTWIASAQAVLGLVRAYSGVRQVEDGSSALNYQKLQDMQELDSYRLSSDSGHGTDTGSPRSSSTSPQDESEDDMVNLEDSHGGRVFDPSDIQKYGLIDNTAIDRFLLRNLSWIAHSRALTCIDIIYNVVDRIILILGFVALVSGIVTYGGVFVSVPR